MNDVEVKPEHVGILCPFKDKVCNIKCLAYNEDPKYPTCCKIWNCFISMTKNLSEIKEKLIKSKK